MVLLAYQPIIKILLKPTIQISEILQAKHKLVIPQLKVKQRNKLEICGLQHQAQSLILV